MNVEFDQEEPPLKPPRGVDPLLWRISHQVWCDHQAGADGLCEARRCRVAYVEWPCPPHRMARVGLLTSAGTRAPWASINRSENLR